MNPIPFQRAPLELCFLEAKRSLWAGGPDQNILIYNSTRHGLTIHLRSEHGEAAEIESLAQTQVGMSVIAKAGLEYSGTLVAVTRDPHTGRVTLQFADVSVHQPPVRIT